MISDLHDYNTSPKLVIMAGNEPNGVELNTQRAWVTLLTKQSYTPGVITLAYSLNDHASAYPLVVLVTPSLERSSIEALNLEAKHSNLVVKSIEPLLLPNNQKGTLIAERFADTWTKLRAFELFEYDACCFLDADITIYKNMDDLFETSLPDSTWIAAAHACVCNLDHDSWAPNDWKSSNCGYTRLEYPSALEKGTSVPADIAPPHTLALLNGGVFLYKPHEALWQAIYHFFVTSPNLKHYQFPDQDFLAEYFRAKWLPLPWKYNALKTMRQWHTNIWRDDEVRGLHYIVDKPWQKRVASDGIGGHLGRDGITHLWWWKVYDRWHTQREKEEVLSPLKIMDALVAQPLDEETDKEQCEANKAKGLPTPIPSPMI